ncbi:MAG: hypothetical protein DMF37_05590 [Verrucomicrobia bacterium]|nr:MAG: hypothetical protein DMF37_05590 [Verrucomicrobiota bacterium]
MTQKNNQKLRIGIVGAGSIVRARHLPALKKHPEVEIVAVSNSTYESSEKFCHENLPHATPLRNWPELVALPDLDIIWIGTPPYMHSAVTISALEAGKHVFCQARMSMDLAEAEEIRFAREKAVGRELYRSTTPCATAKFYQQLSGSERAAALAAKDRDQRTERAYAGDLRRSVAAVARRHRWRLRARKNCPPGAPGLRSDHPRFVDGSLRFR